MYREIRADAIEVKSKELSHYQFVNVDEAKVSDEWCDHADWKAMVVSLVDWILLDNQSTVDVFCNEESPHEYSQTVPTRYGHIHCNAGITSTNMVGELVGYGTVWYNP